MISVTIRMAKQTGPCPLRSAENLVLFSNILSRNIGRILPKGWEKVSIWIPKEGTERLVLVDYEIDIHLPRELDRITFEFVRTEIKEFFAEIDPKITYTLNFTHADYFVLKQRS